MTWSDLKLSDMGMTLLTGIGFAIITPILLPVAGAVLRPILKEVIKAGLRVADTLTEVAAESGEHISDLIAEAKAEYTADRNGQVG